MVTDERRSQRLLACLGVRSRFQVVATLQKGARCVSDLAGAESHLDFPAFLPYAAESAAQVLRRIVTVL